MNGVLPVDKPEELTSHDVIQHVRKFFNLKSVGHAGTLDPIATGLLLVLIGEGTKLSRFLMDLPKTYEAKIILGIETDTDDITGKILNKRTVNVSESVVKDVLNAFIGEQMQIPPAFSAIKHKGKPMYKYARSGVVPELPPRKIIIKDIEIKELNLPEIKIKITCSKGTYIRALARDIGVKLQCGAALGSLRRLKIGPFSVENAITFTEIKQLSYHELTSRVISLNDSLTECVPVIVEETCINMVKNAQIAYMENLLRERKIKTTDEIFKFIDKYGHLIALVKMDEYKKIKILRMFNDK